MVAKEEVAEELNHVHQPGGKDDTEGDDEGDLLDLVVHMWRGPSEPDEDGQGDDVDEEPEGLEQEDMGDLGVRHILHGTEEDKQVCPGVEKPSGHSVFSYLLYLTFFIEL